MSDFTPREKAAQKALKRLHPVLMRMLSPDVRHELYGRDMLTWNEKERIETFAREKGESKGVEEVLKALGKRGPDALDVLVESLETEAEVHKLLILKIRKEWPKEDDTTAGGPPPITSEPGKGPLDAPTQQAPVTAEVAKEFLGNGEWPFKQATALSGPPAIPYPPQEGVDHAPKTVYKMSSKPRGIGVVINNKHFTCGMKDRVGTDRDAEALAKLFMHLGFYTNRYDDLKGKDMRKRMRDVADIDHSQFDCLIVAVLTHGINGKLYSTDGDLIPVDDFTGFFDGNNCPSLIGKPKIFIIQACRGGRFDYGVESETTDGPGDGPEPTEEEQKKTMEEQFDHVVDRAMGDDETDGGGYSGALPAEADFVLAYATVPGYVSWRNSEYGSWFIKAFVDTMLETAHKEHFMDILTEVNRKVAEEFQSKGRNKQIPAPVNMLTRKLFFRPGSFR